MLWDWENLMVKPGEGQSVDEFQVLLDNEFDADDICMSSDNIYLMGDVREVEHGDMIELSKKHPSATFILLQHLCYDDGTDSDIETTYFGGKITDTKCN